jgi:hypothetical protein
MEIQLKILNFMDFFPLIMLKLVPNLHLHQNKKTNSSNSLKKLYIIHIKTEQLIGFQIN